MNRTSAVVFACIVTISVLLSACPAQDSDLPDPVLDVPVAAPPPDGDGLAPACPESRRRASVQMMLVVVVALFAIFLLLRLIAKGRKEPPPTPEQDLLDRAKRVLDEHDRTGRGNGGEGGEP